VGKVEGVKIEIHKGKLAGGAEVMGRFELWSVAAEGNGREKAPAVARLWRGKQKAQKERNCFMARSRDDTIATGISGCRFMGKRLGQGNDWQRNGAPLVLSGSEWFTWFRIGKNRAKTLDTVGPVLVDFPFFQANALRKQHE
jgi:hypothetical protein